MGRSLYIVERAYIAACIILAAWAQQNNVTVALQLDQLVATTDEAFVSVSFDTTSMTGVGRAAINFSDPWLIKLARNLGEIAPTLLRLGGSQQDQIIMNVTGEFVQPLPPDSLPVYYLNKTQWDTMISFCAATGFQMVYGLNAKVGRQSSNPPIWNASNIQQLLTYVAEHNQRSYIKVQRACILAQATFVHD